MKAPARLRRLLLLFDITDDEYDRILDFQRGGCAVCQEPKKNVRLSVDHRHSDGLVRGILCRACNKALAYIRDDLDRARRLLSYLICPPAGTALGRPRYGRPGRTTRKWRTKAERTAALARLRQRLTNLGYKVSGKSA